MDNESNSAMMLMDLGAYEKMLDEQSPKGVDIKKLSEEGLLEKINRDVAVWRAYNDKEKRAEVFEEMAPNLGSSPVVREKTAVVQAEPEESASDIVAEAEEEKFYLEPVE